MFIDSRGNRYKIEKKEGFTDEYNVTDNKKLIFRYIGTKPECVDKVKAMIENRCVDDSLEWPIDIVRDEYSGVAGVLYPECPFKITLEEVLLEDRNNFSSYNFKDKVELAKLICDTVKRLHSKGVIIGNFNPKNIVLNDDGSKILFTNTETYQYVFHGKTYICNRFSELHWPSFYHTKDNNYNNEIDEYCIKYVDTEFATSLTDYFALSVIIFGILMKGYHPYECEGADSTVSAYYKKCIEKLMYFTYSPFFRNECLSMPHMAPALDTIKPLVSVFKNTFSTSDMTKWANYDLLTQGLDRIRNNLIKCWNGHYHIKGIKCPYCKLQKKYESSMIEKQEMLNKNGSTHTLLEHKKLIHQELSIPFQECINFNIFLNMSMYKRIKSIVEYYKVVEDDFLVRIYHHMMGKKRASPQSRKTVLDCLHSDFPSVRINNHVVYAIKKSDIYNCDFYRSYSEIENQRYDFVSIVEYVNEIIEVLPNDRAAIISHIANIYYFEHWNKTMNAEIDSILKYLVCSNKILYENGKYDINPKEYLY